MAANRFRERPLKAVNRNPLSKCVSFRNLLYVYPRFANLSNRSGASRNISLRVELMDAHERPMQLVFGKSSCPDVSAYANTAVCYHNKLVSV